jgi:hypothetical protein
MSTESTMPWWVAGTVLWTFTLVAGWPLAIGLLCVIGLVKLIGWWHEKRARRQNAAFFDR